MARWARHGISFVLEAVEAPIWILSHGPEEKSEVGSFQQLLSFIIKSLIP